MQKLVPLMYVPVQACLLRFPSSLAGCTLSSLEIVEFRNRVVRFQETPAIVHDAFERFALTSDHRSDLVAPLSRTATLAMGLLTSHIVGKCWFTYYSDTYCASAFFELERGIITLGAAEGLEGCGRCFRLGDGVVQSQEQVLPGYGSALEEGVSKLLGQPADVERLFEIFYEDGRLTEWRFLEKKRVLNPIRVTEHGGSG